MNSRFTHWEYEGEYRSQHLFDISEDTWEGGHSGPLPSQKVRYSLLMPHSPDLKSVMKFLAQIQLSCLPSNFGELDGPGRDEFTKSAFGRFKNRALVNTTLCVVGYQYIGWDEEILSLLKHIQDAEI